MRSSRGCLPPGWSRVEVSRKVTNTSKKYDVYFYSNDGVKLRSFPEIEKYFEEKGSLKEVERSCFNFVPVQTPVLRESCYIYDTLNHKRYLTVNREKLKQLLASDGNTFKQSQVQHLPVDITKSRNEFGNIFDGSTKNSEVASSVNSCTTVEPLTAKLESISPVSTKENVVVENGLDHNHMKNDSLVFTGIVSSYRIGGAAEHSNLKFQDKGNGTDSSIVLGTDKRDFSCIGDKISHLRGSHPVSFDNIPFKKRKLIQHRDIDVSKVEDLAEKVTKKSSQSMKKGSVLNRKSLVESKSNCNTNATSADSINKNTAHVKSQPVLHFRPPPRSSERIPVLNRKRHQCDATASDVDGKCPLPSRRTKRDRSLKTACFKTLKTDEPGREFKKDRKDKKMCKKSSEPWLQCHRSSDTEKVQFVQKLNKNWSTSYVTKCCGKLNGWTRIITQRQCGISSGTWDVVYRSPKEKRFRSKRDIERFLKENSINISPDLFCFKTSVLDFTKSGTGRKSKRNRTFKKQSNVDLRKRIVKEGNVTKQSLRRSNCSLSTLAAKKQYVSHQGRTEKVWQLEDKEDLKVKFKVIKPGHNEYSLLRPATDCDETNKKGLQVQTKFSAANERYFNDYGKSELIQENLAYQSDISAQSSSNESLETRETLEHATNINKTFADSTDSCEVKPMVEVSSKPCECKFSSYFVSKMEDLEHQIQTGVEHLPSNVVHLGVSASPEERVCSSHAERNLQTDSQVDAVTSFASDCSEPDDLGNTGYEESKDGCHFLCADADVSSCRNSPPVFLLPDSFISQERKIQEKGHIKHLCLKNPCKPPFTPETGSLQENVTRTAFSLLEKAPYCKDMNVNARENSSLLPFSSSETSRGDDIVDSRTHDSSTEIETNIQSSFIGTKVNNSISFQSEELRDKAQNKSFAASEMQRGLETAVELEAENVLDKATMLEKLFRTKELRWSTVDDVKMSKHDFLNSLQFRSEDVQDLIAQKTNNNWPEALDKCYKLGENQDVDNTASVPGRYQSRALSSFEDRLTVEKRRLVIEEDVARKQHGLSQQTMDTYLLLEKNQERTSLSKQKVSPSSRCDIEGSRVINNISLEDLNRSNDIETLPRQLKRTIKYNDKVLQFFKQKFRNCKKKTNSEVSGYFVKQRCPKESVDMQEPRDYKKRCMVFDVGCVNEIRSHNERTVSNKLTKANLTEVNAIRVSNNSINAPDLSFINNAKDNDLTLISKCNNDKEAEVIHKNENVNKHEDEESEAKDGRETPISECVKKGFNENNGTVSSDMALQTTQDLELPELNKEQCRKCGDILEFKGGIAQWGTEVLGKELLPDDVKKPNYSNEHSSNYDEIGITKNFALSSTESLDWNKEAHQGSNVDRKNGTDDVKESGRVNDIVLSNFVGNGHFEKENASDNPSSVQANQDDIISDKNFILQKISQDSSIVKSGEMNSVNFSIQRTMPSKSKGSVCHQNDASHVGSHRKRTGYRSPYFNCSQKSKLRVDSKFISAKQLSSSSISLDRAYSTCDSKETFASPATSLKIISRAQNIEPYSDQCLHMSCDEKVVSGETGLVGGKFSHVVEREGSAELGESPLFALAPKMDALHLKNNAIGKGGARMFLNSEQHSTLQSLNLFPEKLNASYNRQGAQSVLQVSDSTVDESVCYKCGRIMNDKQIFQRKYSCSTCDSRSYSSTVALLDLERTISNHSYADEDNLCKETSKYQYSSENQKSFSSPKTSKAYYLESLGLVEQFEFCNDQANNESDGLYSMVRMPIEAFDSVARCGIEAKEAQSFATGLHSTDDKEDYQHRFNTPTSANAPQINPFILHRRYGIQRTHSRNYKKLRKNLHISPYFYFGVKTLLKSKKKSYRKSHFVSVRNGATLKKQTDNKGSKKNLFQKPVTFEESCMVGKNDNETRLGIERGCNILFCDASGTKVVDADCISQHVNDEDTESSYALLCDDSYGGKQNDLPLCSENTSPDRANESNATKPNFSSDTENIFINWAKQAKVHSLNVGTIKRQNEVYTNGTEQLRGKHTIRLHIPPRSPYGLIQEQLYDNPWKMLIACLFLNRTTAKQVLPVIWKFFERWPDPETTMNADWHYIEGMFYHSF